MSAAATDKCPEQTVGRYAIFDRIAAGGMASVHLARLVGSAGFSRVVAAKRMHRHFLQDPDFKRMFLVEARLAARILHPNVVPILDVLSHEEELIIVMEYVHGESLLALMRAASRAKKGISVPIGCAIVAAVLEGLHAAHEARNEQGEPLGIVHRDVSPQNVLVGADGVARVLDFGIAKAVHAQNQTNPGTLKGKFSYMAPEVVNGAPITRQADVFSAGVVLWEALAGRMLFRGATEQERLLRIIGGKYPSPRQFNPRVSPELEATVAHALQLDTKDRYATALEFAIEIERVVPVASRRVVSEWVQRLAARALDERATLIHTIETSNVVHQGLVFTPVSQGSSAQGSDHRKVDRRTPPPVPVEKISGSIPTGTDASAASASTANARRAALIREIEATSAAARAAQELTPRPRTIDVPAPVQVPNQAPESEPPAKEAPSAPASSLEIECASGLHVGKAQGVSQRKLTRALLVTFVAVAATLASMHFLASHSRSSIHDAPVQGNSTKALVPAMAQIPSAIPAPSSSPELKADLGEMDPTVTADIKIGEAPNARGIPADSDHADKPAFAISAPQKLASPAPVLEPPAKDQHHARRVTPAPPPTQTPSSRANTHAKHYLPSNL